MKILVTGTNRGFGAALSRELRIHPEVGQLVSLNRTSAGNPAEIEYLCDFEDHSDLGVTLSRLVRDHSDIHAVILNAGVLGPIGPTDSVAVEEFELAFQVNFFANKVIVDAALRGTRASEFIQVSSGATETVYEGWATYSLSKLLLRRIFDFYRAEIPDKSFVAVSPGPMKTAMNREIRSSGLGQYVWADKFGDDSNLLSPEQAARVFVKSWREGKFVSGSPLIRLTDL